MKFTVEQEKARKLAQNYFYRDKLEKLLPMIEDIDEDDIMLLILLHLLRGYCDYMADAAADEPGYIKFDANGVARPEYEPAIGAHAACIDEAALNEYAKNLTACGIDLRSVFTVRRRVCTDVVFNQPD